MRANTRSWAALPFAVALVAALLSLSRESGAGGPQCSTNGDCKGSRVCAKGRCVDAAAAPMPAPKAAAPAPVSPRAVPAHPPAPTRR